MKRNVGLIAIGIGWLFAFAALAMPEGANEALTFICFAIGCFGFGAGWLARSDSDR